MAERCYHFPMSPVAANVGVLSFEEARHVVERHAAQISEPETEAVEILSATGRVLAEPIFADRDFPPFPRATRDGFAVRAADVAQTPARLRVIGEIKAGDEANYQVESNQAAAIMTGAALPAGADAVVMVEYTAQSGDTVEVRRSIASGENFVPAGSEARAAQMLVERGTRLDAASLAIAASVGRTRLGVFRKPRVAVLSTGDEVVPIEATPGPTQIRNSNSYSLAAQIQQAGAEAIVLPIAPDETTRLRTLIEQGLEADLLLMTGGVSMGKYDLVEQVLSELNAEFYFTGAQIQPGRPVVFGSCSRDIVASDRRTGMPAARKKYFFGLPGNPISTMVTFELFVRPIVGALAGMKVGPLIFLKARLKADIKTKAGLKRFLPALVTGEFEDPEVELIRWQGSGDIAALARANCYVVIANDRESMSAGELVPVMLR